jgi:quercetin dioxygenase-like cupin family protein
MSKEDSRGTFKGIINSGIWEEINLIDTVAGCVRGGHYHKHTSELFYIIDGEIEVEVSKEGCAKEVHLMRGGSIFMVEPYEVHTFRCLTKCIWINVLSRKMDESAMDFFTTNQNRQ